MATAVPQNEPTAPGTAGQWQLIWGKFKHHRLAVLGGIVVIVFYLMAIFSQNGSHPTIPITVPSNKPTPRLPGSVFTTADSNACNGRSSMHGTSIATR